MRIALMALGLAMTMAMSSAAAQDSAKSHYESTLDQFYDLTYGRELANFDVEEGVQKFLEGMKSNPDAKACPELGAVLESFANNEFRNALTEYMASPELRDELKAVMRKHYKQADLDAYLAFAATPAGAVFLEHREAAEADAKRAVADKVNHMEDSPIIKKMLTEMMGKMIGPMMKCKRD
jgi:hypothetical protein